MLLTDADTLSVHISTMLPSAQIPGAPGRIPGGVEMDLMSHARIIALGERAIFAAFSVDEIKIHIPEMCRCGFSPIPDELIPGTIRRAMRCGNTWSLLGILRQIPLNHPSRGALHSLALKRTEILPLVHEASESAWRHAHHEDENRVLVWMICSLIGRGRFLELLDVELNTVSTDPGFGRHLCHAEARYLHDLTAKMNLD
jgi:hypothetical protein